VQDSYRAFSNCEAIAASARRSTLVSAVSMAMLVSASTR
jgi:hypothetical protein